MFDFAQRLNIDTCYRCGEKIGNVDDLSIEHKTAWQSSDDPIKDFYDLGNIAFSHLNCNRGAAISHNTKKECCKRGHNEGWYVVQGGKARLCKVCNRESVAEYRKVHGRKKYKSN